MRPHLGPDIDRGPNPDEGIGDAVPPFTQTAVAAVPAPDPQDGPEAGAPADVDPPEE